MASGSQRGPLREWRGAARVALPGGFRWRQERSGESPARGRLESGGMGAIRRSTWHRTTTRMEARCEAFRAATMPAQMRA
eukprot:9283401-Alexandrium_andersonii.AAC.1